MRDCQQEIERRVAFIKDVLAEAGASGIVLGLSGGKDSALAAILCKMACDNTLGVMLPCQSRRNYEEDVQDALLLAQQIDLRTMQVDLSDVKQAMQQAIAPDVTLSKMADANINPRLRMTALYAIAQSENALVCGTGNRSEAYVGYYTKWGDGACDFNPIADLTVGEIYAFLRHLDAPKSIIEKAPSAALFEGQTDEQEMGLRYADIDRYLLEVIAAPAVKQKIEAMHARSAHKRRPIRTYESEA